MSRRQDPEKEKWIKDSEATIHKEGYIISYRGKKPEKECTHFILEEGKEIGEYIY